MLRSDEATARTLDDSGRSKHGELQGLINSAHCSEEGETWDLLVRGGRTTRETGVHCLACAGKMEIVPALLRNDSTCQRHATEGIRSTTESAGDSVLSDTRTGKWLRRGSILSRHEGSERPSKVHARRRRGGIIYKEVAAHLGCGQCIQEGQNIDLAALGKL